MDYNIVIAFIGGIFGGLLFRLISEYLETKSQQGNLENKNNTEHSLLFQYHYAIARVYEGKDDNGFPIMTIKPLSMCEDETEALIGAREEREYEMHVALSNPTSDISDYWKANNIRAIKIYEVD